MGADGRRPGGSRRQLSAKSQKRQRREPHGERGERGGVHTEGEAKGPEFSSCQVRSFAGFTSEKTVEDACIESSGKMKASQ